MFKRIFAVAASVVFLTIMFPGNIVCAKGTISNEQELKETTNEAVSLLQEVVTNQYAETEDEIKQLIVDKGYDFNLSIDTFYDQENPFKDVNYLSYLAAYMSCKSYARKQGIDIPVIAQIKFIDFSYEEKTVSEYVPTEIDEYIQCEYIKDEYQLVGTKYIIAPSDESEFVDAKNGHYKKTGRIYVLEPDTKEIEFIDISLKAVTVDEMFVRLGIDKESVIDDYESRMRKLSCAASNDEFSRMLSLNVINEKQDVSMYQSYANDLDGLRKIVVNTALSLVGNVPYEWGGKASGPGIDPMWFTYNELNGLLHGLDCSGFVQWTFMTSGFPNESYKEMYSTTQLLTTTAIKRINQSELEPGDIGVTLRPDGEINHTGIYLGNNLWIHCSSSAKTVIVSSFDFNVFYDPFDISESLIDTEIIDSYGNYLSNNTTIINSNNISYNIDIYK